MARRLQTVGMALFARPSLFVRLTATFALAIALPFAGSAWFALRNATNWVESEAQRREQTLAALAGNLTLATIERAEVKLATLARLVASAPMFSPPTDSQLLEAQVEPPDVFLELQNIDAGPGFAINSQVQQRALPADIENDRLRAMENARGRSVQEPIATRLPWRSPQFETLRDVTTLAVSAPCLQGNVTRGVLVGYVDFKELRAALSRAAGGESRVIVGDGEGNVLADTGNLAGESRSIRAPIAESGWSVEVSERREDIAAPLVALRKQIAGFGALGLLLALVAGSALASWISRPIARLESATKRMAAGDLAARSGVAGSDEIGRLGQAFDTMAAGFERLDTAKSAFVGNVSHELRTPLTSLRLSIENLLAGVRGELSAEQRSTLTRVERDLIRLSKLVDDLLELARLESGSATARCEPSELRAIAAEALVPWRAIAAARDVRVEIDGEGRACVDPALLRRALSNLIDNAIKFSPEGGRVDIRISPACVTIQDEGPGIEGEKVFERFVQGEQHGTKSGGVGIGLSIVRKALRMMGAEVAANVRPDGKPGALFVVRLRDA